MNNEITRLTKEHKQIAKELGWELNVQVKPGVDEQGVKRYFQTGRCKARKGDVTLNDLNNETFFDCYIKPELQIRQAIKLIQKGDDRTAKDVKWLKALDKDLFVAATDRYLAQ